MKKMFMAKSPGTTITPKPKKKFMAKSPGTTRKKKFMGTHFLGIS